MTLLNRCSLKKDKPQIDIKIKLPTDVKMIINKLAENGHKAYAVGGCIRDSLIGRLPKDWDICTSAAPNEIENVFAEYKHILTGERFGTVTIVVNDENYEVTTFRSDGEYKDNRRPESVAFSTDLKTDLSRRDFTINAMAYNDDEGLIDLFGGYDDLKNNIIRCVGNPDDRFKEDALRMLRCVRFAFVYDFNIDEATLSSIQTNEDLIQNVSVERLLSEYNRIIKSNLRNYSHRIIANKLFRKVIPEFCLSLCKGDYSLYANIALTFYFSQDNIDDILNRFKIDNKTSNHVKNVLKCYNMVLNNYRVTTPYYMCKKILNIDDDHCVFESVCDIICELTSNENILLFRKEMINFYCDALNSDYSISQLNISGNDLIEIGYQGKEIGIVLDKLLDLVMREEVKNDKDALLFVAKHIFWN